MFHALPNIVSKHALENLLVNVTSTTLYNNAKNFINVLKFQL